MKIVVALTGSSGVRLGIKFLKFIAKTQEVYVIISQSAKKTMVLESCECLPNDENITYLDDNSLDACVASGSFGVDSMAVVPCSMNSMAKFTTGISDTLITRAFSVMLKENRPVLIAPREMPYNQIQLKNMLKLSKVGVHIAPPVMGYYSGAQTMEDMENFIVGKWCDLLGIKNDIYKRWV